MLPKLSQSSHTHKYISRHTKFCRQSLSLAENSSPTRLKPLKRSLSHSSAHIGVEFGEIQIKTITTSQMLVAHVTATGFHCLQWKRERGRWQSCSSGKLLPCSYWEFHGGGGSGVSVRMLREREDDPNSLSQMRVEGATLPAVFWIPTPHQMCAPTQPHLRCQTQYQPPESKAPRLTVYPPDKLFCRATRNNLNSEKLTFAFRESFVCVSMCMCVTM